MYLTLDFMYLCLDFLHLPIVFPFLCLEKELPGKEFQETDEDEWLSATYIMSPALAGSFPFIILFYYDVIPLGLDITP
jgi:hypothetical protein